MAGQDITSLMWESVTFFLSTMMELTFLFIGISFLVGILNELLPQEKVRAWLSGKNGRGYLIGSLLGGLTPFCSCSTIPFMVGLLRAQAGFGPIMAFLFTSPLVNPIIVPLFISLVGLKVTAVYVVVAVFLSVSVSFFLEYTGFSRFIKSEVVFGEPVVTGVANEKSRRMQVHGCCNKPGPLLPMQYQSVAECCDPAVPVSLSTPVDGSLSLRCSERLPGDRFKRIFSDAVHQFKSMLPYIVIGVVIGSVIHGFLPADFVASFAGDDNPLAVPVSAVLGIPLYLRVSAMIPIAGSLIAKGMSVGAVIALIVGGAGASLPEVVMLKGLFRLPLLVAFLASVLFMAVSAGYAVNLVLS